jgi:hypothetical protein
MKFRIYFAVCVLVFTHGLPVRALDTAAQAQARAALEKELDELENPSARPETKIPHADVASQPDKSTNNSASIIPVAAVTPNLATTDVASATAIAPIKTSAPTAVAIPKPVAPTPVVKTPVSPPAIVKPTRDIVPIYGEVFKNAQVEKVQADGVIISYWNAHGGFELTWVDFNVLTPEFRKQCVMDSQ